MNETMNPLSLATGSVKIQPEAEDKDQVSPSQTDRPLSDEKKVPEP